MKLLLENHFKSFCTVIINENKNITVQILKIKIYLIRAFHVERFLK